MAKFDYETSDSISWFFSQSDTKYSQLSKISNNLSLFSTQILNFIDIYNLVVYDY